MKQRTNGYTLLEVIIASFLMAVVVIVAGTFWFYVRRNYEFSMTQYRLTNNMERALANITTELRRATEAMNGAYPLEIVQDNHLVFYADTDSDGQVERINYYVLGSDLMRGVIEPSGNPPQYTGTEKVTKVAEQLSNNFPPIFQYYNGNWPGDTINNPLPLAVRMLTTRMIKVKLSLDLKEVERVASYSAESMVQIRNLKDNL